MRYTTMLLPTTVQYNTVHHFLSPHTLSKGSRCVKSCICANASENGDPAAASPFTDTCKTSLDAAAASTGTYIQRYDPLSWRGEVHVHTFQVRTRTTRTHVFTLTIKRLSSECNVPGRSHLPHASNLSTCCFRLQGWGS